MTSENEGVLYRLDKATGSEKVVIAGGLRAPVGITQDSEAIYFVESVADGAIWRMVK